MDEAEKEKRRKQRFPPSAKYCDQVIERLKRFQDLVRHHQRWGSGMRFARPIEDLIPKLTAPQDVHAVVEREINRAIPGVSAELHWAGVHTGVSYKRQEYVDGELKMVERHADLFINYFELPRDGGDASFFNMLMNAIDRGIGVYEHWKGVAERRKRDPRFWIAQVINLPSVILQMAGFHHEDTDSKLLSIYLWLLRIVILAILFFIATKLGLSVPWSSLKDLLPTA